MKHVCQFGSSPHRVEHENCLNHHLLVDDIRLSGFNFDAQWERWNISPEKGSMGLLYLPPTDLLSQSTKCKANIPQNTWTYHENQQRNQNM